MHEVKVKWVDKKLQFLLLMETKTTIISILFPYKILKRRKGRQFFGLQILSTCKWVSSSFGNCCGVSRKIPLLQVEFCIEGKCGVARWNVACKCYYFTHSFKCSKCYYFTQYLIKTSHLDMKMMHYCNIGNKKDRSLEKGEEGIWWICAFPD